ncbi:MAG: hypothetical protein AAB336_14235, partial [Acidobacteriota bacterium]
NDLSSNWESEIPHIQALVKNKHTNLPGQGFDGFLEEKGESWDNNEERRAIIESYWAKITHYPYWDDVLAALEVEPAVNDLGPIIANACGGGGGEGPDHLALKAYICANPQLVGLKEGDPIGELEYGLPSGDRVDVVFSPNRRIHAVEVKPIGSSEADITRGLFQCVKYHAVLKSRAAFECDNRKITVCLALGGMFPNSLVPLRNSLGIQVFDSITSV